MRFNAKSCVFIEHKGNLSLKFLGNTFSKSFRVVKENNSTNNYYINVGTETFKFHNAIESITSENQQIIFVLTSRVSEDLRMPEININISKTGVSISEIKLFLKDKIGIEL